MLEINTPYEMPDGNVLTIGYDEFAESPRDAWDNLGTFVTFDRDYKSPDTNDFESLQDVLDMVNTGDYVYALVEQLDHSGVWYYRYGGALRCQWDAAVVGIIFADYEKICNWYEVEEVTKDVRMKVYKHFDGELEIYTNWCNGGVYGYKIETIEGEYVDSCYGFYDGVDSMLEDIGVIEEDLKEVEKVTTYHYKRV